MPAPMPYEPAPQYQPAPKSFDQAGIDTDLYSHQKVGRPYSIEGKRYTPKHNPSYDETGIASWYGPNFHGKLTANGETYDKNGMTAAHKTLPLNSMVVVTNLENGKQITLRLNDRGPFVDGRIIDLSQGAAKAIGIAGLGKVRVQYAGPADPMESKMAKLGKPSKPVIATPKPVQTAPAPAPVAQAPSYKPLSVVPFDLKEPVSLPQYTPQATPRTAPVMPAPMTVPNPGAPGLTRKAPLALTPDEAPRGRQEFTPPEDGGVMTLTITGPIHMASAGPDINARFIPAVHEGEAVKLAKAAPAIHYVQAATFSSVARAYSVQNTLSAAGSVSIHDVQRGDKTLHRVLVGPYTSTSDATRALSLVATLGYSDAKLVEVY